MHHRSFAARRQALRALVVFALLYTQLLGVAQPAMAVSTSVVISQIYGGAGCGTAGCSSYKNDYIELFNRGTAAQSVNGWSVQYGAATGTTWQVTSLPNVSIPVGGYLLVAEGAGANGVNNLPTPDATGTIAMSATAGKVALVNSTTALSGACPSGTAIVDLVGFGSTANCSEGTFAPAPSTTTADLRAGNGATDTDNNAADFTAGTPNPRNSSSAGPVAPNITTQPQSQTILSGGTATLSVTASGTAPLSYQWYQGSASDTSNAIAGATSASYTTPALSATTSYWVRVSNSAGNADSNTASITVNASACSAADVTIGSVQGSTDISPQAGNTVTVQGTVVGDYEGMSPALHGFYLQDAGDNNAATSDGIFVFESDNANRVNLGDVVQVTGVAGENQGQTQIGTGAGVPTVESCGSTGTVAPADVTLPFGSASAAEQYEGMLVRFHQTLYVTEHFQLGRFGQVVMSSGGRLKQPTNITAPGPSAQSQQAANDLNQIIVDDDTQAQNPDPILFGRGGNPLSAANTLRGADTATDMVGVMTYTWAGNAASGNAYRLRPVGALGGGVPSFQAANARPASPPSVGGTLRVTAANLLNYFNTFGTGACAGGVGGAAMDCRGADNLTEFNRQWLKTVAALAGNGADVIAVMELENDGYGSSSAIQDLVTKLNNAAGANTYAFIDADAATGQTNALGTDAIKVAMIYKPGKVTPVGTTAALNSTEFVNGGDSAPRNRPALAQAFEQNSNGARFILVANHLKSKGSACDAPDAGDGQGNCNTVRTNAANLLTSWLASNPTGTGDPDVLIVGDLNSYAKENPITAIENAGYTNLIEDKIGQDAYSYAFDGQWGYLDHALASASLTSQVAGVGEWHINADEPSVLDYNTDFKSTGQIASLYSADQYRVSDHDPVIVGLNLDTPAATAPAITTQPQSQTIQSGQTATLSVAATGTAPLSYQWYEGSAGDTSNPIGGATSASYTTPALSATTSYWVRVSNSAGNADSTPATITVNPAASASVVISQVYGGGGSTSTSPVPSYKNDYIELYNRSTSTVSLSGWSVQYAATAGTTWQVTSLTGSIAPGGYYLIQEASATGATGATLPNSDASGNISMAAANGKVALASSTTALSGSCPTTGVVDLIGYGTANCFEGSAAVGALSTTTAALRNGSGATDTNNNSADFTVGTPNPRNSQFGQPTTPSGTGTATPNSVTAGNATLLTVAVTPGTNPASSSLAVTADLTAIGGSATQALFDDGTNGDATAGDNTFSFSATVANGTAAGAKNLAFSIADAQSRSDGGTIALTVTAVNPCNTDYTHTFAIQGSGMASPVVGQVVTTQGVVTADFQGTANQNGFYLQDLSGDSNPLTSDGIFVFGVSSPDVAVGDVVRVTGSVQEFNNAPTPTTSTLTEIGNVTQTLSCGTATVPAPTLVSLPEANNGDLERYEGMLVTFQQTLTVEQNFFQGRYGQVTLGAGGRLYQPTNDNLPGSPGAIAAADLNARSLIVLDDAKNQQNLNPTAYIGQDNTLRAGDTTSSITGVLDYGQINSDTTIRDYRIQPTQPVSFTRANQRTTTPDSVGGNLKVASFNVLNYFSTIDQSGAQCFPTNTRSDCRGADSAAEFTRQRDKEIAAIVAIDPDVAGLMEMQNNGDTAVQNLVDGLNAATSPGKFAIISTPNPGGDAIKVAMIYQPGRITPVGAAANDTDPINNRNPLAQTFTLNSNGAKFTVVVNHLKSKGCDGATGANTDQGDGQGCWNALRVQQAQRLLTFIGQLQTSSGDPDVLAIGDFNSYGKENPITTLTDAGMVNEIAAHIGGSAYSYVFDGMLGYLDHALASSSLNSQVSGVAEWHINADEPSIIDYNTEFKSTADCPNGASCTSPDYYTATPYRASDHDPVVIGLNLDNSTPTANGQSVTTAEDTAVNITLTGSDPEGHALTYSYTQPAHGTVTGTGANVTYTPAANYNGADSFTFKVNDGTSNSAPATVSLTVTPVNDAPVATDQPITTAEDTAKSITLAAADVDGDTLTYSYTQPAHGTVTGTGASVTYTPNANYNGIDSFTFKVNDGTVDSNLGTISITVTPVNDNPVAINDSLVVLEDANATAVNVLANDSDVDGDTLSVTGVTPGSKGVVTLSTGAVSYKPNANANGSDSFSYTVSDGHGGTATGTVNVMITPVNDNPTAVNDMATAKKNGSVIITVLANDTDVDGDTIMLQSVTQGTKGGTATKNANGTVTFKPKNGFTGTDTFTYSISDGHGGTATATVTVTVTK